MNSEIISLAKQFRIRVLSSGKYVIPEGQSAEDCLLAILREEAQLREKRVAAERLKQARFPTYKDFKKFDTDFQKGITDKELEQLAKLEWVDSLYNVILIGPPGTGKTHIALAIGNKAVRDGVRVAFHTMNTLVHLLKTQEISAKSKARLNYLDKCELIIIDEIGYLPVSKVEANLFFSFISQLYEKTSVVITSNKGFAGWVDVFGDAILVTALLDRLTHRCQVIQMTGEGYRVAHREYIFDAIPGPSGAATSEL
jgi:DNA replication protein DnaC